MAGDAGAVAAYLSDHYAWAVKALVAGSLAGCTVLVAQLLLGAAEEADAKGAEAAVAAAGGSGGGSVAKGRGKGLGEQQSAKGAAAVAASAAAGAFPAGPARRLVTAARAADGFSALQVDVQEALAVAEMAVARMERMEAGKA